IVTPAGSGTGEVTSSPAGIECGHDCEEEYEDGETVVLTGAPGAHSEAVQWTGCDSEEEAGKKCVVTMSAAKSVSATFGLEKRQLSVSVTGSGTGSVSSSPAGISCSSGTCTHQYDFGTVVTLTPSAGAGSEFKGWSGACSGTGSCVVTMS